ncbi:hypothetical protein [Bradyrhizobium sp. CSS354]|uniref:hypothetical protein n=1 Tax=Bradyrhizobium sp. CSS354 TaxID=2699172 RepID=UPI0023B0BA42|nr:hypothetical protein [Bradyrhizobium sp. CSS354]MDE5461159.1 hypothetical protein [Bradyrhizobium sp. CSS354]
MMNQTDQDALTRSLAICRTECAARAQQLDAMLAERPWLDVARFASYCSQTASLSLDPWETPPCSISDIDAALKAADNARGIRNAARLLQKMTTLGLSRFEPDPLLAIRGPGETGYP